MIGITFKLKNEYSNYLFKIFDKIGVDNFIWYIEDNEIIYKDKNNHLNISIFNEDTRVDFLKKYCKTISINCGYRRRKS